MAENATIGALRVVLGADTASFEDGLKKAQSTLSTFGINLNKIIGGLTVAGALTAIEVAFKKAIDHADELGKAAQKIGVPVEELSKLEYAAELSGLKLEDLTGGFGKLAKAMSLAAGGSEDAKKGFNTIGVAVTGASGVLRPISDVVADIAGKFENMKDGAGKTALAIDIFGKSGANLIPLLNSGAKGLKEMYAEAEQLGLVITDKTYKAAESFNDNLTRLGKVSQGMTLTVMAQLVPALQTLSGMLFDAARNSGMLSEASDKTQTALTVMTTTALYAITGLKGLADVLNTVNEIATNIGAGNFGKAADNVGNLGQIVNDLVDKFGKVPETAKALLDGWKNLGAGALDLAGKIDAPALPAKNFQKALDDIKIKTIELQGGFSNLAPGFVAQAVSLNILDATHVKFGQTLTATTAQQIALNNALMTFRGAQITEENLLPWDKLNLQITQLNTVLASGQISFDTYQRAAKKAADAAGMSFTAAGMSISQSFVDVANSVGGPTSRIVRIAQIAATATALVNVLSAQAYALAGPFPANLVAFALVAAKGAALVAAIKAASVTPAMAAGGSFTVPGGSSGVDNRMVTMALAAGERVDVTPAGRGSGGEVRVVRIEGLDKPRYTLDEVKGILDVAGQAMRDGYQFKVA